MARQDNGTNERISVVVIDDQESVRNAFSFFVEADSRLSLSGSAADGIEGLALIRSAKPDVALVDIRMPGFDGIELCRRVNADPSMDTKIVIVTTFDLDEYLVEAFDAGVSGFLLKTCGPVLLSEAVLAAANGETLVSPSVTLRMLKLLKPQSSVRGDSGGLSMREVEVVRLVAQGKTNGEIAESLFLSTSTVKTHLSNVQVKLDLRNRVEVAAWAWRRNILDSAD